MSRLDLFLEVFPLITRKIPALSAYRLVLDGKLSPAAGAALAGHLRRTFDGAWFWDGERLVCDTPAALVQLEITLDHLREQQPALYRSVQGIEEEPGWDPTTQAKAQYIAQTTLLALDEELRQALRGETIQGRHARVERLPLLRTWVVGSRPALSISIRSHLVYNHNVQQTMEAGADASQVVGLAVADRTAPTVAGEITAVRGTLGEHRVRLLTLHRWEAMQTLLRQGRDDEYVVTVRTGEEQIDYPASALDIRIRLHDADECERFSVQSAQALRVMRLKPDEATRLVRSLSSILKQHGVIDKAYNSRDLPKFFALLDSLPDLAYGGQRVFPYDGARMAERFVSAGVYRRHHRYEGQAPIRIAVINTLEDRIGDFVEALRRQIERDFGYGIEMIRERSVRVVSQKNIESAVRVVEKENPHIVLAFLPDSPAAEQEDDLDYRHLKSLTLGRGIASHVIYESTMHDADAMPLIIMGILAKTGSVPFVLAEPLPDVDYVVGLDLVRERMTKGDRVTGITRVYRNDGAFVSYQIERVELDEGQAIPIEMMQTLFSPDMFEGRRVIVHVNGELGRENLGLLVRCAGLMRSLFYPVEIMHRDVPRMYGLQDGRVTQPAWGSIFWLTETDAFVSSSFPVKDRFHAPLYVRVAGGSLKIDAAVYSVLLWTLLHYGAPRSPRLPVTTLYADEIAHWLARGALPDAVQGDIPFWL